MIRIRFHGRGGHGTKTASRMVGSAAYLAGFQAQDSPVYGAERRGAPIAAFTRINESPILERGVIEVPDLVIVADETLLSDPLAGVMTGAHAAAGIFVNADSAERMREAVDTDAALYMYDITKHSLDTLGKASALSAGLAAAAARLSGVIEQDHLLQAVHDELSELEFPEEEIAKNVAIARDVFGALPAAHIEPHDVTVSDDVVRMEYDDAVRGAPSILNAGNADLRHTGDWRVEMPVINHDICTRCGLCAVLCPDGAIALDEEGYPVIDYDHCKGCMICRQICPPKGIDTRKEVTAW